MALAPLPVLVHFFGATSNDFYANLGVLWAQHSLENIVERKTSPTSKTYTHILAHCHLGGKWSFPDSLSADDLLNADQMTLAQAIGKLSTLKPVAAVPHMFCLHGQTSIRGLFELIGIPVIGNSPALLALVSNKWRTNRILEAAGVSVPKGELLTQEEGSGVIPMPSTMQPPFIIKPCSDDNSRGLSLYRVGDESTLKEMLAHAFSFENEVIVEEFIPLGHEVRAGVIEDESKNLVVLPIMHYKMDASHPCRTHEDKFNTSSTELSLVSNDCELPATSLSNDVVLAVEKCVKLAHKALGCRLYSLFDVRISPEGVPHILEATLVCSYGDKSTIIRMNNAWTDREPYELFHIGLLRTLDKKKRDNETTEK